jgi:hypothetical protein
MLSPRASLAVLAALVLTRFASSALAVPIEHEFSGRVQYAPANGPVHVGDRYDGRFFYDPDRVFVRWNITGYKGYDFQFGAAGMRLDVTTSTGVVRFGTLPGYVLSEVIDDAPWGGPPWDRFWMFGGEQTDFPPFYRRLFVQIYLNVFSYDTALVPSTDLPAHLRLLPGTSASVTALGGPNFSIIDYSVYFTVEHLDLANQPPDCSAAVGHIPPVLAVDGGFAPVTIDGVTDPDGDPVTIAVTGVTEDEPVLDVGVRPTCPDAVIDDGAAQVRMERSGRGDGRVYRVAFTASDGRGGSCDGAVDVCVPHHPGETCGNDGTVVNATDCGDISTTEPLASASPVNELRLAPLGRRAWAFEFSLAQAGEVSLSIVDVAGRSVATLARSWESAGAHRLEWRAESQRPGVYFARLRVAGGSVVRRYIVL